MTSKNIISYQTIFSQQIYLNSSTSMLMNGTLKSYVHFFIQDALNDKRNNTIEQRVSLVNAQIPCSFYQINNNNNTIIINGINYTFPNGNYNVNNFISTWYSIIGSTWLLSFSSITNKLIFTYTSVFTFTDNTINSIFPVIGFTPGISYSCIGSTLQAPYPVNFSGLPRILVSSPTFSLNSRCANAEATMSSIIGAVPINSLNNGIIYYTNYTNYKSIFSSYELSFITIMLQDDNDNMIDMNNIDWAMTLQIDTVVEVVKSLDNLNDIYENAINELQN
jgi:hypothetical protein